MIDENDDNEVAVLELLALNPFAYFPPLASGVAEDLADKGLVIFSDGWWYPTAEGLTEPVVPCTDPAHRWQHFKASQGLISVRGQDHRC